MKVKSSKQISVKEGAMRVSGGGGHMIGKKSVGTQTPGSMTGNKSGGGKWATGGPKGKMVGFTGVKASKKL